MKEWKRGGKELVHTVEQRSQSANFIYRFSLWHKSLLASTWVGVQAIREWIWYRSLSVNTMFIFSSQLHANQPKYLENTVQRSWELSIDTLQYSTTTPLKRDTSTGIGTGRLERTSIVLLSSPSPWKGSVVSLRTLRANLDTILLSNELVGRIERACPPRIIYSASQRSRLSIFLTRILEDTKMLCVSEQSPLPKPTRRCLVSSKVKWEAGETQADLPSKSFANPHFPGLSVGGDLLASSFSPLHTSTHTIFKHRTTIASLVFS